MKTNSIAELLKAKGIQLDKKEPAPIQEKSNNQNRKRLYQSLGTEKDEHTSKKVETKWRQTEDKVETESTGNQRQSRDKVETNPSKLSPLSTQSGDKVETELETVLETKWRQTREKVETKIALSTLVGLQRKLVIFLYHSCKAAQDSSTEPLTVEHTAKSCEASISSVKKTLQRLEKRSFIKRSSYKNGRSGWTKYELAQSVFQDLLRAETRDKLETKWSQTRDKVESQLETQPETSLSSSSRDLLIKEESTSTQANLISRIDLSSVQQLGITASVLARCIELYPVLKPEQLEILVFRFAEFVKDPKNRVQNARGFFISLAEQASKGQVPLDHIETPDERLMRLFLERQKEAKARRVDVERAAQDFECETWLETLTPEMKLAFVPENAILKAGTAAHTAMLKRHFAENVWPERRKEILDREVNL